MRRDEFEGRYFPAEEYATSWAPAASNLAGTGPEPSAGRVPDAVAGPS